MNAISGPAGVRPEINPFLDILGTTAPGAMTACLGWTAHEIAAHLASGADGLADQAEAFLEGRPIPVFGDWEQRELPYREMPHDKLVQLVADSEVRMSAAFAQMLERDPNASDEQVGWGMPVIELIKHMRQEYAIHRWDLAGDDDEGNALLSNHALLEHSVEMLEEPLLAAGVERDQNRVQPLEVRVRCEGQPDLVVDMAKGVGSLRLTTPIDAPNVIETDRAARLILLWGRRPADPRRMHTTMSPDVLERFQRLLLGF